MTLRLGMLSIFLAAFVVTAPAAANAAQETGDGAPNRPTTPALRGADFVSVANFDRRISAATFAPGADVRAMDDIVFPAAPDMLEPGAWALLIAAAGLAGAALRTRRPPAGA